MRMPARINAAISETRTNLKRNGEMKITAINTAKTATGSVKGNMIPSCSIALRYISQGKELMNLITPHGLSRFIIDAFA
jgi:hypothetical protein